MQYEHVTTTEQLAVLCDQLKSAQRICFDTEFVSEFTYRPDLCLIQVEFDGRLAVIDTHAVRDVTEFWNVVVDGDHQTIVHAGREEIRFCMAATGRVPARWFDVQLAAGMVGLEYPISYAKLLQRLLDTPLSKQETRTDWRRRPLTPSQMEYALQDVIYLPSVKTALAADLKRLGREAWFEAETQAWQQSVTDNESREKWRRITGASGLPAKALRIVKELWRWRESQAQQRDCPPKRVLRDDLIVELARRGKSTESSIRAIRGFHRRDLEPHYPEISAAIEAGLHASPSSTPKLRRKDYPSQINLLGQFLGTALTSICRRQDIASSLVGTVQDVRDLVAFHLGYETDETPALATGWRAEIVGHSIEQLLAGKLALRIADPHSEAPLAFDPVKDSATEE